MIDSIQLMDLVDSMDQIYYHNNLSGIKMVFQKEIQFMKRRIDCLLTLGKDVEKKYLKPIVNSHLLLGMLLIQQHLMEIIIQLHLYLYSYSYLYWN